MKQIPKEMLEELIDIAIDLLAERISIENIHKIDDAETLSITRTIADARNILNN